MKVDMLFGKIHQAVVTDANLDYVGSITIDLDIIKSAGLLIGQKVDVVNLNNGERFSTYIIEGKAGSKVVCLNGAAARKVQKNDRIIVIAYASMDLEVAKTYKPKVVILDEKNNIKEIRDNV